MTPYVPPRNIFLIVAANVLLFWSAALVFSQDPKRSSEPVDVRDFSGMYKGSYALLIGASKYQNKAWKELPGVREDIAAVERALRGQGFEITKVLDPTAAQLRNAFDGFINKFGREADSRLLFYFAGHGYTIKTSYGDQLGYLVPVDAPDGADEDHFKSVAMNMHQIEIYAEQINAKHALFVFDSCFSGSVFDTGVKRGGVNSLIWEKVSKPVREILTSGSAFQQVPDKSVFRQEFITGINGEADINNDGYVTGAELNLFIQQAVAGSESPTIPQFGTVRNPHLRDGDFVFTVPNFNRAKTKEATVIDATYHMPEELVQAISLYSGTGGEIDEPRAKRLFVEVSSRGDALATMWIARHYFLGRCGFRKDESAAQEMAKAVIEQIRELAERREPEAMFLLGDSYYWGLGVPQDYAQSLIWLRKASERGNPAATNSLGAMYGQGRGVPKDPVLELAYYQRAQAAGSFMAPSNIAWSYRNGEGVPVDCSKSLSLFTQLAEKGFTRAMYGAGDIYSNGCREVKKDLDKAIKWHTEAAEKGYSDSMYALALIYRSTPLPETSQTANKVEGVTNKTVRYDFPKAIEWYEKAIDAGDDSALTELGGLYREGAEGLNKDEFKAFLFFKKYADAGRTAALMQLGWCYEFGSGVAADKHRASMYYEQAADRGDKFSMTRLGKFYYDGKSRPQDFGKAEKYFRQTVGSGFPQAEVGLGEMYEKGKGVAQSYQQAIDWYSKVAYPQKEPNLEGDAQTGTREAQEALGRVYESDSVVRDMDVAISWYRRAAFLGSKEAMERLAVIYETGKGVEKNSQLAEMWRKNANGSVKRFTVPCDLNGQKLPFYVFIVEEYPPNEDNPMKEEGQRISTDFVGATLPVEVIDSFKRLLKIARDNKVSFPDLCVYALGAAGKKEETKK